MTDIVNTEGTAQNLSNPAEPITLYWTRTGRPGAVPLLLVNGLGSPHVAYEPGMVAQFNEVGFDVLRLDNRNMGQSTATTQPYTLSDMAADAAAVLDAVGWDTTHIFGQSMGGTIVQQFAIDAPERLRTVTSLMSGTGNPAFGQSRPEIREILMEVAPTDREGWLEHRVRTESAWRSTEGWDPEWVRAKGEVMFDYGADPEGVTRQYQAVVASGQRDEGLAKVKLPFLVLHGSEDTLITPDAGRHTADIVPGARYVEIPGLGHDLPPAYWPVIVAEVAAFVGAATDDLG